MFNLKDVEVAPESELIVAHLNDLPPGVRDQTPDSESRSGAAPRLVGYDVSLPELTDSESSEVREAMGRQNLDRFGQVIGVAQHAAHVIQRGLDVLPVGIVDITDQVERNSGRSVQLFRRSESSSAASVGVQVGSYHGPGQIRTDGGIILNTIPRVEDRIALSRTLGAIRGGIGMMSAGVDSAHYVSVLDTLARYNATLHTDTHRILCSFSTRILAARQLVDGAMDELNQLISGLYIDSGYSSDPWRFAGPVNPELLFTHSLNPALDRLIMSNRESSRPNQDSASTAADGGMDIISGGSVVHVDGAAVRLMDRRMESPVPTMAPGSSNAPVSTQHQVDHGETDSKTADSDREINDLLKSSSGADAAESMDQGKADDEGLLADYGVSDQSLPALESMDVIEISPEAPKIKEGIKCRVQIKKLNPAHIPDFLKGASGAKEPKRITSRRNESDADNLRQDTDEDVAQVSSLEIDDASSNVGGPDQANRDLNESTDDVYEMLGTVVGIVSKGNAKAPPSTRPLGARPKLKNTKKNPLTLEVTPLDPSRAPKRDMKKGPASRLSAANDCFDEVQEVSKEVGPTSPGPSTSSGSGKGDGRKVNTGKTSQHPSSRPARLADSAPVANKRKRNAKLSGGDSDTDEGKKTQHNSITENYVLFSLAGMRSSTPVRPIRQRQRKVTDFMSSTQSGQDSSDSSAPAPKGPRGGKGRTAKKLPSDQDSSDDGAPKPDAPKSGRRYNPRKGENSKADCHAVDKPYRCGYCK